MKVRNLKTGKIYKVVKINYKSYHPSSITEYVLEDGKTYTNGEMWSEFVQVPELVFEEQKEEQ